MLKVNDLVYDGADPRLYKVARFLGSGMMCRIINTGTGYFYNQFITNLKRVNKYRVGDLVVLRKKIRKVLNMDKLIYVVTAVGSDDTHQPRYRIEHSGHSPMYAIREIDLMIKRIRNK